MSFEYDGCFDLAKPPRNLLGLQQFFAGLGLTFSYASSRFRCDEEEPDYIFEDACESASWHDFVANAGSNSAALNATFKGGDCQFTLGFFADARSHRHYALFEVTNRDIERLGRFLNDKGIDVLEFMVGMYRALGATSFAFGIMTHHAVMMSVLRGRRSSESDEELRMCIGLPAEIEQPFKRLSKVRVFVVDGVTTLARWLPGLEERFDL